MFHGLLLTLRLSIPKFLLLNLNFSSAVLLSEVFPVLTDLGFLDLYGLDLGTLEGLLNALLG
jgi:hypothetical protein